MLGVCALLLFTAVTEASLEKGVAGRSVEGRPIVVWHQGDPDADFRVLVVGSVHGDERQGIRVVSNLRQRLAGKNGPRDIGL